MNKRRGDGLLAPIAGDPRGEAGAGSPGCGSRAEQSRKLPAPREEVRRSRRRADSRDESPGKPPHKSYATTVDSLAQLRAAQGRNEEAEKFYTECLKIHKGQPSSNLKELAETCERYADVLYKLQKEKQADALMERVAKLREAREKLLTATPVILV